MNYFSRECPKGPRSICFHYNQVGQKKPGCSRLTGGATWEPASVTLRITDDHEGRVEAPMAGSQAYPFQVEEA